ncbi:MAG: hypothetical protein ACPGTU_07290 [Myxococcota bacterium]
MLIVLMMFSCIRPSDPYDVILHGEGTQLDQMEAPPAAMGGRIELARYTLAGTNLGYGVTGLFGDAPRADGKQFVVGSASFGYPSVTMFDRESAFLSPGPTAVDTCVVRPPAQGTGGPSEYVDVGDAVLFSTSGRNTVILERDPASHPRPAGESWYVGYGDVLMPMIEDHPDLPDTWKPGASWSVTFPGTVPPAEATFGAIPYPLTDTLVHLPPTLDDFAIAGAPIRSPNHGYNRAGEWTGEDDDVRFTGPFVTPMGLTWTPSRSLGNITLVVRLHGEGVEGVCDCTAECDEGFSCLDGTCVGNDGATWNVLAEVACTVADDGEYEIQPEQLAGVWTQVEWGDVAGATLSIARMNEGTTFVPDVLTWNGKRVGISPVRVRATDILVTRLEVP